MYASESWINEISIDVWFGQYLKIWCKKNLNIEKITLKVVLSNAYYYSKIKFMVVNVQNIFMGHNLNILMIFGIKEK